MYLHREEENGLVEGTGNTTIYILLKSIENRGDIKLPRN